jgi:hypothetical protein
MKNLTEQFIDNLNEVLGIKDKKTCHDCNGTGMFNDGRCDSCNGTGHDPIVFPDDKDKINEVYVGSYDDGGYEKPDPNEMIDGAADSLLDYLLRESIDERLELKERIDAIVEEFLESYDGDIAGLIFDEMLKKSQTIKIGLKFLEREPKYNLPKH